MNLSQRCTERAKILFLACSSRKKLCANYRASAQSRGHAPLLFVQPFGLRSIGGGPRIMRALLHDAPCPSLTSRPTRLPPPSNNIAREFISPCAPLLAASKRHAGRASLSALLLFSLRPFERKLEMPSPGASMSPAIHAVAHGGADFLHSCRVARKLGVPFFLNPRRFSLHRPEIRSAAIAHAALRESWQSAKRVS